MKVLAIVLASGVLAGLAVYAVLETQALVGIATGDMVTMRIHVLVGTIATVGFGSAALALAFRAAFARADRAPIAELERRIAALESARTTGPTAGPITGGS